MRKPEYKPKKLKKEGRNEERKKGREKERKKERRNEGFIPLANCVNLAKTLEYLFSLRFTEDIIPLDLPKQ